MDISPGAGVLREHGRRLAMELSPLLAMELSLGDAAHHLRELRINTLAGDRLCEVLAERDWTIGHVKGLVARKARMPQYKQQLLHGLGELGDWDIVGDLPGDDFLELTLLRRAPQQMVACETIVDKASGTWVPNPGQPLSMWSDHAWVMQKVQCDGRLLEHASDEIKDNREIVMAAVQHTGFALLFASPRLREDFQVVTAAVTNDGVLLNRTGQFRGDPTIALAAATQNGHAAKMAFVDNMFCNNNAIYNPTPTEKAYVCGHMLLSRALSASFDQGGLRPRPR